MGKRLLRRAWDGAAAAASLLVLVAAIVLWVRSYWYADFAALQRPVGDTYYLWSSRGRAALGLRRPYYPRPTGARRQWRGDTHFEAESRRLPPADVPGRDWGVSDKRELAGIGWARGEAGSGIPWPFEEWRLTHWALALSAAVLPAWRTGRRLKRRRPAPSGRCPACGYDLRATPGRCPECGHTSTPAEAPR